MTWHIENVKITVNTKDGIGLRVGRGWVIKDCYFVDSPNVKAITIEPKAEGDPGT